MISRQTFSGIFFMVGLYMAYSNWITPAVLSIAGALVINKVRDKALRTTRQYDTHGKAKNS